MVGWIEGSGGEPWKVRAGKGGHGWKLIVFLESSAYCQINVACVSSAIQPVYKMIQRISVFVLIRFSMRASGRRFSMRGQLPCCSGRTAIYRHAQCRQRPCCSAFATRARDPQITVFNYSPRGRDSDCINICERTRRYSRTRCSVINSDSFTAIVARRRLSIIRGRFRNSDDPRFIQKLTASASTKSERRGPVDEISPLTLSALNSSWKIV